MIARVLSIACLAAVGGAQGPDSCGAWQVGVSLNGRDLSHQHTGNAAECCELCARTVGASACTGWTWNEGNHDCYVKNAITGNTSAKAVSGGVTPGPPLPSPPPTPAPTPAAAACAVDPPAAGSSADAQPQCAWYNASLTFAQRRDALVAALTDDEKLAILAGSGVARLHVEQDGFNEALHGVAWAGRATVFPCPMLLGATWNTSLVKEIGAVVATEALAKKWGPKTNALSFFAPNINIVRDVRWGRAQETYGEDPTLTAQLGAAYVVGMQFLGGSTGGPLTVRNVAKHFAAYNLESNFAGRTTPAEIAAGVGQYRLQYDAPVSNADMLQTFLPAFEAVVQDAQIQGVMCAYNSVDGVPLCANELMATQLRGRMGFDGIVITDCGAIDFMTSTHKWARPNGTQYTAVEATAAALRAGTDLNCGSAFSKSLPAAYAANLVTRAQLDTAVGRSVMGHLKLGLFEDTAAAAADPRRKYDMDIVDSAEHRALAKAAAVEGVVLLKNNEATLPIGSTGVASAASVAAAAAPIKVAVVGPNANNTRMLASSYSGCTSHAGGPLLPECTFVNVLQGIEAAAKASSRLADDVLYAKGVEIDTPDTTGIAAAVAAAAGADVVIVVGGLITCQETGDQCQESEARDRSTPVDVQGHDKPDSTQDKGRDYGIGLPGQQLALLQALANKTTTPIVLVVMSGSGVEVAWAAASPRVGAIVQHFYPGVLGGEALADVLFGAAAPSGKLPLMIPTSEAQLPADYLNQSMQAGLGRTHRYFHGTPLYPFGFGLGYSSFTYSRLRVSHASLAAGEGSVGTALTVSVSVTNNGEYNGASDEVVMVFAKPTLAQAPSPTMSVPRQVLLGFAKVSTQPGRTLRVAVEVPARNLRLVGHDDTSFGLLAGSYELHVGGCSPGDGVGMNAANRLQQPLTATLLVE